ncbi:MAG: class I SAM-dependent methyltransferase [Candidatus Odinarchaeota archaeon]
MRLSYNGYIFNIPDNVYPPSEDTFLLLENINVKPADSVLEIGVGSGFISIQLAKIARKIVATDISPEALKTAVENSIINSVYNIDFRLGDLFTPIKKDEKFTVIIFNPPYLPTSEEDRVKDRLENTWDGGWNGRVLIDRFIFSVKNFLDESGRLYLIQSDLTGIEDTLDKLQSQGFKNRIIARKKYFFEELIVIEGEKLGE